MRKNQIGHTHPGMARREYTEVVHGLNCVALQVFGVPVYTPKQARKLAKALKRAARLSEVDDV